MWLLASLLVAVPVPEAVVELSVAHFIHKPLGLPSDYPEKVSKVLSDHVSELSACLDSLNQPIVQSMAQIQIATQGEGQALVEGAPKDIADCLKEVLASLPYPPHQLATTVTVRLPLVLEVQKL